MLRLLSHNYKADDLKDLSIVIQNALTNTIYNDCSPVSCFSCKHYCACKDLHDLKRHVDAEYERRVK